MRLDTLFMFAFALMNATKILASDADLPFETEMKVCEKYNQNQIYNCDAVQSVGAEEISKMVSLAVHTNVRWLGDQRRNYPIYMVWTFEDEDGSVRVIKRHEDYQNMSFTPSTQSRNFGHAFVGRIWRDEVGRYAVILFHDESDYVNSEIDRYEFEVE